MDRTTAICMEVVGTYISLVDVTVCKVTPVILHGVVSSEGPFKPRIRIVYRTTRRLQRANLRSLASSERLCVPSAGGGRSTSVHHTTLDHHRTRLRTHSTITAERSHCRAEARIRFTMDVWNRRGGRDHHKTLKSELYEPRQARPNCSSEVLASSKEVLGRSYGPTVGRMHLLATYGVESTAQRGAPRERTSPFGGRCVPSAGGGRSTCQ